MSPLQGLVAMSCYAASLYVAEVPSIAGCISAGHSLEES